MTSNKRIHELLEWAKEKRKSLDSPDLSVGTRMALFERTDPLYEILQHLLEENIKHRAIVESWESNLSIALNGFGLKEEKSQKDN